MIGTKKYIPTKENPQRLFGARYIPKCLDHNLSHLINSTGVFLPQRGKAHVNRADFRVAGGDSNVINLTYLNSSRPIIKEGGGIYEAPVYAGGNR